MILDTHSSREVNSAPSQPATPTDADTPFMHLWRDCVWQARGIGQTAKLVLLRIGCFVDAKGRGASISYKQIAADCEIHESTAKSVVAKLQDLWLDIHAKQGRYVPRRGRENLYHVLAPASVMAKVQAGRNVEVAQDDPDRLGVAVSDTNTVRVDSQSKSKTPSPSIGGSGQRATSNSNVIDFPSLKWGGRS